MTFKIKKIEKITYLSILLLILTKVSIGQVKIGNNPTVVNPNAVLELEHTSKGLLLPRLNLIATNNPAPLSTFETGMLVYNLAASGVGTTAVTPGFYYCDGTQWMKVKFQAIETDTSIYNSNGTIQSNRTINMLDKNVEFNSTSGNLVFNSTGTGKLGVGTASPQTKLHVNGKVTIDSLGTGAITDSIVTVDKATGILRAISSSQFTNKVQKITYNVSSTGQSNFVTPDIVTDENKIQLFRNGVQINFTTPFIGGNIITAEIPCELNDEIKIIQIN